MRLAFQDRRELWRYKNEQLIAGEMKLTGLGRISRITRNEQRTSGRERHRTL